MIEKSSLQYKYIKIIKLILLKMNYIIKFQ